MVTVRDSRAPCVRIDGAPTRHELAIRILIASNEDIHRNGFAKALRSFRDNFPESCLEIPAFVPDAYRFDHKGGWIILYEVEDSHPIPPLKLHKMANFWFDLDCDDTHDYLAKLIVVDRYGRQGKEVNLLHLWQAFMVDKRPQASSAKVAA